MPYLFDTSALSIAMSRRRLERHPQYASWLGTVHRREQFTCTTVVGELRFGARHRPDQTQTLTALIDELLSRLTVIPYDLQAAERYGDVRAGLVSQGYEIGEADMQIAACALDRGCTVVTANAKDFSRVTGLQLHLVS